MPEEIVTCETHGSGPATYVCRHLADGHASGLGVHFDRSSEQPWPDMVCTACANEPEWSHEEAVERIRLLCSHCWEDAFGNNTDAHHESPDGWLGDTAHRAESRQRKWADEHGILEAKQYRYELEQSPPWLGFGPSTDKFDILCEPTVIGSWSKASGTWLWGWANSWWSPALTRPIVHVKRTGENLGVEQLWRGRIESDEALAGELSLVALELLPQFSGIYRSPSDTGALFLLVRNTRRVS
jgi:hypothetical protein